MKTNTKAVHQAFADQIKQDFAAIGVHPVADRFGIEQFTVETIAGSYTFHIDKPIPGSNLRFLSVFGRFADPKRASKHVDCNPYSGKWNFDGNGNRKTAIEAQGLASCISNRIINGIMAKPSTQAGQTAAPCIPLKHF